MSKGVISMSKYEKATRPITYEDKIKIRELREQGIGYMKIGRLTGLSRDQVRGFCKRDDGGPIKQNNRSYIPQNNISYTPQKLCIVCGHTLNGRGKYCSDSCRKIGYDTLRVSRTKPKRKIERSDRVLIRDKTIEGFRAIDIAKSIGLTGAQVQGVIDHVRKNNIQHDDEYYKVYPKKKIKETPAYICDFCETEMSSPMTHGKCCSEFCNTQLIESKRESIHNECVYCGKHVFSTKRKRKYCSDTCAQLNNGKSIITPFENECRECGKIYMTSNSTSVTCSDNCMRHRRNRLHEINRRTKLKENGPIDYDISIPKLIERDGLDCYLCGDQVNTETHYNNDDYPNIDHVYPVSKGGTHTWDNVKLTHRKCNIMKRDFVISPRSTFHTNVLTKS